MVMKTAELNPHAASVSPPHPMLGSSGDTIRDGKFRGHHT